MKNREKIKIRYRFLEEEKNKKNLIVLFLKKTKVSEYKYKVKISNKLGRKKAISRTHGKIFVVVKSQRACFFVLFRISSSFQKWRGGRPNLRIKAKKENIKNFSYIRNNRKKIVLISCTIKYLNISSFFRVCKIRIEIIVFNRRRLHSSIIEFEKIIKKSVIDRIVLVKKSIVFVA